ncbi:MAG: threonine/serine exporter family protein [Phycisphaerales bacterium]|nr:MAG: threonine/serine exporter family protein [Phycisphaerales bacterium]
MSEEQAPTQSTPELLEFMYRLGQAYLACGEQTAQVELALRRVANSYSARKTRVVAFPTAIFITLHDSEGEKVTLAEGPLQGLRLDQMADVYTLGAEAQRGGTPIGELQQRLTAILRQPMRFGWGGSIIGSTVLTAGIAMVLTPSLINIGAAAALGAVVGVLKTFMRERTLLSAPAPVVAATIVSALVFAAVKYGLPIAPLKVLIPPLVTFLPGAMLTFGMIELAYGDMVSGTSRIMTGFVQLILLTFGIVAGAAIVGVTPGGLPDPVTPLDAVLWAPWLGALIFGVGVFLHFSAPRNALPWMLLVILTAFAAQQATVGVVGKQFSGFFGMLLATPLGYLIQLRFKGPPAIVTFLPSFWLLVPGALSLMSVKTMLTDTTAGIDGLMTAVFVFASIALGTLMGASLYKWLTERFGAWQLQVGRATRRARERQKP